MASVLRVQMMVTWRQKLRLLFLDVAGLQNTSGLSGESIDAERGAVYFCKGQQLCNLMKYLREVLVLGVNTTLASCRCSESV